MKVGEKIGKILLLQKIGRGYHKDAMWKCKCDCGKIFYRCTSSVKKGKSCGCDKYENLIGKRFGKLTVIKKLENNKFNHSTWLCKCDCGNKIVIDRSNLSINKTKTVSCGCHKKEIITKHNKYKTKIYSVYIAMKQRCYNKQSIPYKYYGGRGIKICDEWLDEENGFINFYNWSINNGWKEGLSIDTINTNADYKPDNCRWTNSLTQMNNTRRNHYVTHNNETHTIAEWARILNENYSTLYNKLKNNNFKF